MAATSDDVRYHLFLSMVLAYCRPFTENHGIGSLRCEYPYFPDFADAEMNERHRRMMDLRNKFLGHSSIEGTKVWLLAPGSVSPATGETAAVYGYAVAKLGFSDLRFALWLHEVVNALAGRLAADINVVSKEVGSNYLKNGELYLLDTGKKPFEWTKEYTGLYLPAGWNSLTCRHESDSVDAHLAAAECLRLSTPRAAKRG